MHLPKANAQSMPMLMARKRTNRPPGCGGGPLFERSNMPFVFSETLDHGTSHPVVARLIVQTFDLLKSTSFSEEIRKSILDDLYNASPRLVRCGEIQSKIYEYCRKEDQKYGVSTDIVPPSIIPHVKGLQQEIETFLYESKNFLRDFLAIINVVFGTSFAEASEFFKGKKKNDSVITWCEKEFGSDDDITKFLLCHKDWISEVVSKRNAVEHPNGYSGVLHIKNYELMPDGRLCPPVWHRNDASPRRIDEEMAELCSRLLQFAEELVVLIVCRNLAAPFMQVQGIPAENQNPECPVRFTVGLRSDEAHKIEKQMRQDK